MIGWCIRESERKSRGSCRLPRMENNVQHINVKVKGVLLAVNEANINSRLQIIFIQGKWPFTALFSMSLVRGKGP